MRIIACALCVIVGATAHGAEVYRSTDANGNVTYSDRPQDNNSQYIYIPTPRSTPSARPPTGSAAAAQGESTAGAAAPPADGAPTQTAEERAEARAKNCTVARERLQSYTTSRRLYRSLPNGEREYLSDDEIDEARNRAAADVETWCR